MPTSLQLRRGTTAQNDAFTGAAGELSVDLTKTTLRVHDGSTAGGKEVVTTSGTQTLTNKTFSSPTITSASLSGGTLNGTVIGGVTPAAATFTSLTTTGAAIIGGNSTITGNFVPSADDTYSLGSPTNMWKDIYVGPGSLYVNGQKVLQSETGIIVVSADLDESLTVKTTGTGVTTVQSATSVNLTGIGNADVVLSSDNGQVVFNSDIQIGAGVSINSSDDSAINFADPVQISNNLTITGNLTVSGTTTTVNTETIQLADNFIVLNSNSTAVPTENAGIEIERGNSANTILRWNESTDRWQVTEDGTNYYNLFHDGRDIVLGTNTSGNYVSAVAVSGTGLSVSGSGEGGTYTVTSNATSSNTISTLVARDGSGNFSAGTITAALSGNATTATTWATARDLSLTGDATATLSSVNGSGNVSAALTLATVNANTGSWGSATAVPTFTVNGKGLITAAGSTSISIPSTQVNDFTEAVQDVVGAFVANGGGITATYSDVSNSLTLGSTATSANTASAIVARDGSGNFSAGTITAALSGNATTATTLQTARTISLGGDLSGSASFNGSADITITATIGANSVALGTDTTGNYVASLVAGTGVTLANNTGESATPTISIGQAIGTTDSPTFAALTTTGAANIGGNLTVTGNLTINGTTTTINSTTVTVDDPIMYLGGDTAPSVDDNKDRGIVYNWHNGSVAKVGFFGYDDSTGYFTFIPDATITSEVASGTVGTLDVTSITGSAAKWTTARTITLGGDLSGSVSIDGSANVTLTATIAADSVALGTDTTGNYVASITNGSYITGGNGGSEGAALTIAVDATSANTASKVVARDASGNFSAGTITATLSGNASTATTATQVGNAVTFNNGGAGAASGQTYNGSGAVTVSYNTIGAPSTTGTNASGTWNISISGNAATATSATSASSATTATTASTANALNTSNNYQVNSLGVGTAASGTAGEIRATNNITAYYSDGRLKENIKPIENALDKVMALRGVTYTANQLAESFGYTNKEEQVGVIAQDVEAVLPQVVKPAPFDIIRIDENTEISRSGENYKTVQYEKLVPLLIQAIKEQQEHINKLSEEVSQLKNGI